MIFFNLLADRLRLRFVVVRRPRYCRKSQLNRAIYIVAHQSEAPKTNTTKVSVTKSGHYSLHHLGRNRGGRALQHAPQRAGLLLHQEPRDRRFRENLSDRDDVTDSAAAVVVLQGGRGGGRRCYIPQEADLGEDLPLSGSGALA